MATLLERIQAADNVRQLRPAEPIPFVPVWRRRRPVAEADRFLARQDTTNHIYSDGCGPRGRAA